MTLLTRDKLFEKTQVMMISDDLLVSLARRGSQTAAERLFRRYHDRVFSYLFRMTGDRELAEDAAQEAFFKGFCSLKTYREKGQFKSWIFTIAHREGLRMLRKETRHGKTLDSPNERDFATCNVADPSPLATELVIRQENAQRLEQALDVLTEHEKQVVLLRLYEGFSFKQISVMMDCPLNTTLGRMHNAVKKLKKEFVNEEADYEVS